MTTNYLDTHSANCDYIAARISQLQINTAIDWRKIKTDDRGCDHPDCENAYYSRGLCAKHYAQTYRGKGAK